MSCTTKKDLVFCQGKTFTLVLHWETTPIVYKAITGVTQAAPVRITAPMHGAPDGWRVAIESVKGMKELNAKSSPPDDSDYNRITVVDANTIELNEVNSADFKAYTSGGYVRYNTPVDLTGYSARMSIKDKVGGTVLFSLTDVNGRIVLNNTTKTITLEVSAADTAALTWIKGVYELELESQDNVVTALLQGSVTVSKEVTT